VLLVFQALKNDIVYHRVINQVSVHAGIELILVKELDESFNVDFASI